MQQAACVEAVRQSQQDIGSSEEAGCKTTCQTAHRPTRILERYLLDAPA